MPLPTSEANSEGVSTTESARQPLRESTFAVADSSALTPGLPAAEGAM